MYNPLIHGTNSLVLALLPKTEFKLLSPIKIIESYNIAPMSGEISFGGFCYMGTAIRLLHIYDLNDLDKVIKYATSVSRHINCRDKDEMITRLQDAKKNLERGCFDKINELLIYATQARQIRIGSSDLILDKEIKKIERNFQPYYLLLILIKHMNPSSASLSESEVKKELHNNSNYKKLELKFVVNKVMESDMDYKSIYNNSCKNDDVLLHEDFINIRNQFVDNEFFKKLFCQKALCYSSNDYNDQISQNDENFLNIIVKGNIKRDIDRLFVDFHVIVERACFGRTPSFRKQLIQLLYEVVLDYERLFETRVNSLKSILAKPSDKIPFDDNKSEFLEKRFPIIFVFENPPTSMIEEIELGEYRSKNPLTIGEHIKVIATDLESHQKNDSRLSKFL